MKLSIVMPCYNLQDKVYNSINTILSMYPEAQVIAVDDGSVDETYWKFKQINHDNFIHVRTVTNHGKGEALNLGFRYSNGEYVCFFDGDMDINPETIRWAMIVMEMNNVDVVVGNKFNHSSILDYPFRRKVMSWFYHILVKILFNIPVIDTQTGIKLYKRKVLTSIMPTKYIREYAVDVELLSKACDLGYKISDIPVIVKHNQYGRISNNHIKGMIRDTLLVWIRKWIK